MTTQLFQTAGQKQDGDRAETEAHAEGKGRGASPRKRLNRRPNSIGELADARTPPRSWGLRAGGRAVAGYRPRLAGPSKQKIKKADAWLDVLAAQLLDLDPILTAAVMLGGDGE